MKLKICFIILFVAVFFLIAAAFAAHSTKPVTGRVAVITTNKGVIKLALYEKDAPITTENFIGLVNRKFYDGLKFHRVEPGFVVQGGDPNGDGTGSSNETIPLEVSTKLKHDAAGVVAMARTNDPDSASCQFYITLAPAPFLDMKYAVFGRVIQGMNVVNKLERGDVMKTVRIASAPKKSSTSEAKKDTAKSKKTSDANKSTDSKKTTKKTAKK